MGERPPLGELASNQACGTLVIDQQRLVAISFERALGALLHPPSVIAADDEDSHCRGPGPPPSLRVDLSQSRAYFAITLAAAGKAKTGPRPPARKPTFTKYIPTNRGGGL